MKISIQGNTIWLHRLIDNFSFPNLMTNKVLQVLLMIAGGIGSGLVVIFSTYFVDNAKLIIGVIGGVAFVLVTMKWPEYGVLSFVALLSGLVYLGALPALSLGPITFQISDLMLLLLIALVVLRATNYPGFYLIRSPLILPLLLFIAAFLLSAAIGILINGVNFNTALRTVRVLILWTIFFPTLQLVRSERALRNLITGLQVLAVILVAGVLLSNRLSPLLYVEKAYMGEGFFRIYYAGDMVLYAMIPITVASLATIKKGKQIWRIGFLGLLLYWLFKTYFRQYWLTLLVVCTLLMFFLRGWERLRLIKRFAPVAFAIMLILAVLLVTQPSQVLKIAQPLTDRLETLGQNPLKEGSLQWRVIESRYAINKIVQYPILGIGLGNRYRPPMESESDTNSFGWTSIYIENGYLYIALMMGLVGLIPFLWLCTTFLLRIFQNHREIRDDGLRAVYLGIGAAFLGMMACNIATPTFVIGTRLVFFPTSMAICEIILRLERENNLKR